MEKKTQIKDTKLQQPKGIILYPAIADSLVGKMAGFKKPKRIPPKKKPQTKSTHTHAKNSQ